MYHSNSQLERLYNTIKQISSSESASNSIKYVEDIANKYSLDVNLLAKDITDIIENKSNITSPYKFVCSVAYRLAMDENNKYKKTIVKPYFTDLHLELDKRGFTGELWEKLLIDNIEEHCHGEFTIKIEDLALLNEKIIKYCVEIKKLNGIWVRDNEKEHICQLRPLKRLDNDIVFKEVVELVEEWHKRNEPQL